MQNPRHSSKDPNGPHPGGHSDNASPGSAVSPQRTPPWALSPAQDSPADPVKGPGSRTRELEELLKQQRFHTHTSAAENSPEKGNQFPAQPSPQSSTKPAQTLFSPARLPLRLLSETARIRFPSPIAPGWKGTGIDFTPNVTLVSPPGRGCAAGRRGGCQPTNPPGLYHSFAARSSRAIVPSREAAPPAGSATEAPAGGLCPSAPAAAGTEVKLAPLPAQPSLLTPLFRGFVWLLCEDGG